MSTVLSKLLGPWAQRLHFKVW